MNRFVRVVDGVRDLAIWLSPAFNGGTGRGPLAMGREAPSSSSAPSNPGAKPPLGSNPAFSKATAGVSVTDMSVFEEPTA